MPTKKSFMPQYAIHLSVPVEEPYNKDSFKLAAGLLAQQVKDYAAAIEKNPNCIIPDVCFITTPADIEKSLSNPVNTHLAELMAAKAPPKVTATKATKKLPEVKGIEINREPEEEQEVPVVKAMTVAEYKDARAQAIIAEEEAQLAAAKPQKAVVTAKSAPAATTEDPVKIVIDKIFENLKRTEKSVNIVTAFAKAGKEMTLDELMKDTKLNKNDLCSWLNQTGKNVKAIMKTGRGLYKLDPDKA